MTMKTKSKKRKRRKNSIQEHQKSRTAYKRRTRQKKIREIISTPKMKANYKTGVVFLMI